MTSARRMWAPAIDRQILLSLASTVHRAKLDAFRELEDLQGLPDGTQSDHHTYWSVEAHRLEAGHLWLLELLAQSPGGS